MYLLTLCWVHGVGYCSSYVGYTQKNVFNMPHISAEIFCKAQLEILKKVKIVYMLCLARGSGKSWFILVFKVIFLQHVLLDLKMEK